MAGRRGNNEGVIYQWSSDGRWLGVALLRYDTVGRRIRRSVSATTRAEMVRRLKTLNRETSESHGCSDDDVPGTYIAAPPPPRWGGGGGGGVYFKKKKPKPPRP